MEVRLTLFLACTAVTLIINTAIIFFVYKAVVGMSAKVTESVHRFQTSSSTRQMLTTLESVSAQAVKVTGTVKEQIAGLEPKLEKLQVSYSESLSRADVRCKLASQAAHFTAEKTEELVKWPVRNVCATSAGINGFIAFIRGSENGADASSRRNQ